MTSKQLSVRVPVDLLEQLKARGASTRFIIDAIREKMQRERDAEIAASLLCLADDEEANDISDFALGQAKVMRRVD